MTAEKQGKTRTRLLNHFQENFSWNDVLLLDKKPLH